MGTIGQPPPLLPADGGFAAAQTQLAAACAADTASPDACVQASSFVMAPKSADGGGSLDGGNLPPAGGGSDGDGRGGGKEKDNAIVMHGRSIPVETLARALRISLKEAHELIDADPDLFEIEIRVYRSIPRNESFETFFTRQLKHCPSLYRNRLTRLRLKQKPWFQEYLSQQDERLRPVITMYAADLMIMGDLIERDGSGMVTKRGQRDLKRSIAELIDLDAKALGVHKRGLAYRLGNDPWKMPPTLFLSVVQKFLPPERKIGPIRRFVWLRGLGIFCALHWRLLKR